MGQTGGKERRPWSGCSHGSPLERVAGVGACVGGQMQGWLRLTLLVLAAQRPGKLPETRLISDERQTERGK